MIYKLGEQLVFKGYKDPSAAQAYHYTVGRTYVVVAQDAGVETFVGPRDDDGGVPDQRWSNLFIFESV